MEQFFFLMKQVFSIAIISYAPSWLIDPQTVTSRKSPAEGLNAQESMLPYDIICPHGKLKDDNVLKSKSYGHRFNRSQIQQMKVQRTQFNVMYRFKSSMCVSSTNSPAENSGKRGLLEKEPAIDHMCQLWPKTVTAMTDVWQLHIHVLLRNMTFLSFNAWLNCCLLGLISLKSQM